jgi:hypothetical protein
VQVPNRKNPKKKSLNFFCANVESIFLVYNQSLRDCFSGLDWAKCNKIFLKARGALRTPSTLFENVWILWRIEFDALAFWIFPQGSLRSSLDYGCHLVSSSGLASLAGGPFQSVQLVPLASGHVSSLRSPEDSPACSTRSARRTACSCSARSARIRTCTTRFARRRARRPV